MKPELSLRGLLIAAFMVLGLVLVVAYSLVSTEYFIRGLDASMANNMEKAARTFNRLVAPKARGQGREFSGFYLAADWEQMPVWVHEAFARAPERTLTLYKETDGHWFRRPDHLVFLMRYEEEGAPLYIAKEMTGPVDSDVVDVTARQNRRFLVGVTLAALAFVGLICWLLLRMVSRPTAALRAWTHSLNSDKLAQPVPDFGYPELNEMADLIRSSLSSVQAALEREQRFLRHASHELRTPISTIRSNIELQRKLDARADTAPSHQATLDRIDRASLTMLHLTETLLWLNHQPDESLPLQPLDLAQLVQELATEMAYLLTGKPVQLQVTTDPCRCSLPAIPARIVVGNLIRNAYQHCWQGQVEIAQQGRRVLIRNPLSVEAEGDERVRSSAGYGLGLELTRQLSHRLGWHYRQQVSDGCYQVELVLGDGGGDR